MGLVDCVPTGRWEIVEVNMLPIGGLVRDFFYRVGIPLQSMQSRLWQLVYTVSIPIL